MMKRKWVIIRIETKSREFLSKMLISYCLLMKGYGVIITGKLGTDIYSLPRGVYLINSLYRSQRHYIRGLKKYGHKIALLDEEGLVYQSDRECIRWLDRESLDMIDHIYCFGKDQNRVYKTFFPQYSKKIFITGNPRMNLLNAENKVLVSKEVEKIKSKYGSFVLIVSLYSWANHNDKLTDINERREYMRAVMKSIELDGKDDFDDHFDYDIKMFEAMKEMVKSIHEKIGCKIVVRPHPSESISGWESFVKNMENVEVVREGPLLSWIIASDLIVENNCTSAIESMYLHVPALSYRPYRDERFDQPLPNLLSKNIGTSNEMIEEINNILSNPCSYDFKEYESKASEYVSFQDGIQSAKEITKRIGQIDIKPIYYSPYSIRYIFNPKRFPYLMKKIIKKMFALIPTFSINMFPGNFKLKLMNLKQDITWDKYGDITEDEVLSLLEDIDKLWGNGYKIFKAVKRKGDVVITTGK